MAARILATALFVASALPAYAQSASPTSLTQTFLRASLVAVFIGAVVLVVRSAVSAIGRRTARDVALDLSAGIIKTKRTTAESVTRFLDEARGRIDR